MGVPGALQVRLHSPRASEATVATWSLPAYAVPSRSGSVMMGTGEDLFVIRPRIAEALGIEDGDLVKFDLVEIPGETFELKVKVKDMMCDVLLHDLTALGIATGSYVMSPDSKWSFTTVSGRKLVLPMQDMWAGLKDVRSHGSACLYFDGASRNNPHGPAGYGFHIAKGSDASGKQLVRGYGYSGMNKTSNEMEYTGLIEGLIWATRLELEELTVCGDSELIIMQVKGVYEVNEPRLKAFHAKVAALLKHYPDLTIEFRHVPREENDIADHLANSAIDLRENAVACHWPNVIDLMKRNPA